MEETADTIPYLAKAMLDVEPVDWLAVLDDIIGTPDTMDFRISVFKTSRSLSSCCC